MKCSKCGNEIPSQSRFCLSCGQQVPNGNEGASAPAVPKKRIGLWAAIAGIVLVGAVLAFMASKGRLTQGPPSPNIRQTPVLNAPNAPNAPQPNILQTDVEKPPLDINQPEKPEPPADVVAYLAHLKKVEKLRQDVCAKELNDLVAKAPEIIQKAFPFDEDADKPEGTQELAGQASQFSREWQQVSAYFLSVRPPESCGTLAGKYYDSLREFVMFMGNFQNAVNKLDLAKLKEMKRTQVSVDQKLNAADQELAQVCKQYNIDKAFSIQSDTGETPLLGF